MTALRLIVVGLGARAQTWLDVIAANPDLEIVGLCDPDAAMRDRAAHRLPGVALAADLAGLGDATADAVLLVTPPAGRRAQVEAALARGLAILAEKPLADDLAEATALVEMAEDAGLPLIVGLNFRYLAVTQAMRALFDTRAVGKPEFARFLYERWRDGQQARLNKYPLTMDHPMLWEQSVHHFDLMRHVYRAEPARLYARAFNPSWSMYRGAANIAAIIDFECGLTLTYQGTWAGALNRLDFNWRTDCSEGVVVQNDMFGGLEAGFLADGYLTPQDIGPVTPWVDDATGLLAAFVAHLRGGPEICTGRDHLSSLAMLAACIASAARGQAVEVAEFIPPPRPGASTTGGLS